MGGCIVRGKDAWCYARRPRKEANVNELMEFEPGLRAADRERELVTGPRWSAWHRLIRPMLKERPAMPKRAVFATTMGLFEMVLEVDDLALSERFYRDLIGLPVVERWGDDRPAVWLTLGREAFLGLWPVETGGAKAIHGGRGGAHVHYALRVPHGTLDRMRQRLEDHGLGVEHVEFRPGDRAIYVDDPDGNVLELTERVTLWDGSPATEDGQV